MIYLIRHAQSKANVNLRCTSHANIELTEQGKLQSEQLAIKLPHADRIFISSFTRTLQTAKPLAVRDQLNPEVFDIHEFSYLSDFKCQNTTLEERKPFVDAYWTLADPYYKDAEDAESFAEFYQRVENFSGLLNDLKYLYQVKKLMIFSHGQFLTLLKLIAFEHQELSKNLMNEFRKRTIDNPIQNTDFFIYA
ncbi:histidine phosphatase family protein [Acinetobacter soli]|uniref:histidine phosphatase family protein n=1 Tax=Acinetobacter soli TaxID=487316 RepID=UPI003AA855AD